MEAEAVGYQAVAQKDVDAAVSDDASRRILAACMHHPLPVREISEVTSIPMATTYRHVNDLTERGLLVVARSAISPDGKRYDLYRSRLTRATIQVTQNGVEISWDTEPSVEERLMDMWQHMRL